MSKTIANKFFHNQNTKSFTCKFYHSGKTIQLDFLMRGFTQKIIQLDLTQDNLTEYNMNHKASPLQHEPI